MALTERLCQIAPGQPGGEPTARHIAYDPFFGAMYSLLHGSLTVSQIKSFYDMTADDETELDGWVSAIVVKPTLAEKVLAIDRAVAIICFWQQGDVPGYQDYNDIRTHLGAL